MFRRIKLLIGDIIMDISYSLTSLSSESHVWSKCCLSLWKSLLSITGMRILPIITISDYIQKHPRCKRMVLKTDRHGISICSSAPFNCDSPIYKIPLNDIGITKFNNVIIAGGSDSIIDNSYNWIINDFCVDKSSNIYSSDSLLCREKNNWGLLRKVISRTPSTINCGIMLSGKFSNNYYHCLYENLNRCMFIDDDLIPIDVPLLVDRSILAIPSLRKLVDYMLQGAKRVIIPVDIGQLYHCKKLYYIDHLHYIIPHHRKLSIKPNERSYYDYELIKQQRELLLKHKEDLDSPTRIFLTRANSASRLYNEEEIYDVIKEWGFVKVAPEKLSLEEQINLFYNAKYIIGGSGAAFSNIIFCQSNCNILCFRAIQSNDGTPIFKTIANVNNSNFWHYSADKINNSSVHSDYYISPDKFKIVIKQLWGLS